MKKKYHNHILQTHCIVRKSHRALTNQGNSLYKLKNISVEPVKMVAFHHFLQMKVAGSNLLRLCLKLFKPMSNLQSPKYKVRKAAKIRNRYNQVPHLTQDTTWESDKNKTSQTRTKRSALFQQVTTRQQ